MRGVHLTHSGQGDGNRTVLSEDSKKDTVVCTFCPWLFFFLLLPLLLLLLLVFLGNMDVMPGGEAAILQPGRKKSPTKEVGQAAINNI